MLSVAFYRVQTRDQGPLDTETEEDVVFADALPKDGKKLQNFIILDTRVNIVCRFTIECVFGSLPQNVGCLFT